MAKRKQYVVANPRGIPEGVRIIAVAPPCKNCDGFGEMHIPEQPDPVPCSICKGEGRVLKGQWFEGDAVTKAEVGSSWAGFVERGFIVKAD